MSKLLWRIRYDDRKAFDSSQGVPEDSPGWGVQVITEPHEKVGRRFHGRTNYYIWLGDCWVGVDFVGLIDHFVNVLGIVKVGRMIDREEYRAIFQEAIDDPDFPAKSGWLQGEVRD